MGADEKANPFAQWKRSEGVTQEKIYDRNGREVSEGDTVHIIGKVDVQWRVSKIKIPSRVDPRAPQGIVEVTLSSVLIHALPGGQPLMDLLKTKDATENAAPKGDDVVDPGLALGNLGKPS